MKRISLKNKILKRLMDFEGNWIHKGTIETRAKEWGYLGDCGTRRLRELCAEGRIEKKEERGSVLYRYAKNEIKKEESKENINYPSKIVGRMQENNKSEVRQQLLYMPS